MSLGLLSSIANVIAYLTGYNGFVGFLSSVIG